MESHTFLENIHRKIELKKKRSAVIKSTSFIVGLLFVVMQSISVIHNDRMNGLWANYEPEKEVYEWDISTEISYVQLFDFLVDEFEINEVLQLINEEQENLSFIETIEIGE